MMAQWKICIGWTLLLHGFVLGILLLHSILVSSRDRLEVHLEGSGDGLLGPKTSSVRILHHQVHKDVKVKEPASVPDTATPVPLKVELVAHSLLQFLSAQNHDQTSLQWIAFLGDSILRHEYFYIVEQLLLVLQAQQQQPTTSSTHPVPDDDYTKFKQAGLTPTRILCCPAPSAPADSQSRPCRLETMAVRTGRPDGKVHPMETPIRHVLAARKAQQPELAFCLTWQYVNFPDEDLRREVESAVMASSADNGVEPPLAVVMNGGLHSLMRNHSLNKYRQDLQQLHALVEQLTTTTVTTTRFLFHDITLVEWTQLPVWKQHITNERIQRWNRHAVHRVLGTSQRMHLVAVSAWTRHFLGSSSTNEHTTTVSRELQEVQTVGDGMHLNEAFHRRAALEDMRPLLSEPS